MVFRSHLKYWVLFIPKDNWLQNFWFQTSDLELFILSDTALVNLGFFKLTRWKKFANFCQLLIFFWKCSLWLCFKWPCLYLLGKNSTTNIMFHSCLPHNRISKPLMIMCAKNICLKYCYRLLGREGGGESPPHYWISNRTSQCF